jgi:succinate dehydrogenase/fumarate reductase flavoprotein subunit
MTKDYNGPGLSTFIRHGGYMVNALGERFITRYAPDRIERAPAGTRYKATWEEIQEGPTNGNTRKQVSDHLTGPCARGPLRCTN